MRTDLDRVLARYPAPLRPIAPPQSLGNAGGLSGAAIWRFDSRIGPIAARCWPVEGPSRIDLGTIHSWLRKARPLGFVPVPVPALDGSTIQVESGHLWELAPWMPGRPDPEQFEAAFEGLARFHQVFERFRDRGPSPGLVSRLREMDDFLRATGSELDLALRTAPDDERRALARRWIDLARWHLPDERGSLERFARRPVDRQPSLRDARPDHFLFVEGRLTGLVDFGAMGVESPMADVARLIGEWIGPDRERRGRAIAAYTRIRPVALDEIEAFERSRAILLGGHWAKWHFLERRSFDPPTAVLDGLRRGLNRITSLGTREPFPGSLM